mmetsp:Transcript_2990/g.4627  ORF Transcript_2990/g.4627 Transcript_2990/m.4627 type:complete len:105 (+) Transcript_2990:1183-1497(+)
MAYKNDWCVQQRIKQDEKLAAAEVYAKKMQDIGKTSVWHERQQKFQVARNNIHAEKQMKAEVEIANRELRDRRKERLRRLLQEEARQYQNELRERGLALYVDKL